jgi:hypothetical protein
MANYLKMLKKSQVLALLELGWSYRRIQRRPVFAGKRFPITMRSVEHVRPKRSPAQTLSYPRHLQIVSPTTR